MIRRITPRLQAQIEHERELKAQRLIIANYCCENPDCPKPHGDWRGLTLSHNVNKGMGGTRHVYSINEVQILCSECHNLLKHHIKEIA